MKHKIIVDNEDMSPRPWKEFRSTGLVLFVNQLLHVFGWALIFELNKEGGDVVDVYPARVKFRGFGGPAVWESYERITKYLKENIDDLDKEVNNED